MSEEKLKNLVLPGTGGTPINEWIPEEFGFVAKDDNRNTFVKGKYELRRRNYNSWLLRKYDKNKKTGNTEILVKWFIVIEPKEVEFANMMFTLGLR